MKKEVEKFIELNKSYLISIPITLQWFENAVELLNSILKSEKDFYGTCRLLDEYQSKIKFENIPDWFNFIKENINNIESISASFRNNDLSLRFSYYNDDHSLNINISSLTLEMCNKVFSKIEDKLTILPYPRKMNNVAVKSVYSLTEPLEFHWFKKTINFLKAYFVNTFNFRGSYNLLDQFFGNQFETNTLEAWLNGISQNWKTIIASNSSFSNEQGSIRLNCDHQHSLLEFNISSSSIDKCNNMLHEIQNKLNIIRILENPYLYRKSAVTYKIGDWNKKVFIDIIEKLLVQLFKGQEPRIRDTYVTKILQSGIERLQGFHNLTKFLEFIKESDDSTFESVNFAVEGPNSIGFGITLNKKDKRLEFRSSIPPNEVEERITKLFKEPLQLKLIKTIPAGSNLTDSIKQGVEKKWPSYLIQIIIAIIGATALIIMISKAILTDFTLEITNPIKSSKIVNSSKVKLDWYLWPNDTLIYGPDYDAIVTLLVIYNDEVIKKFLNIKAPFVVPLEKGNGEYILELRPKRKARPVRIIVIYNK